MSIIESRHTVEIHDLIKAFSKKYNLEWNDACDEIDSDSFRDRYHDIIDVTERINEMDDDEYYLRAWTFLWNLMKDNNVVLLQVIN